MKVSTTICTAILFSAATVISSLYALSGTPSKTVEFEQDHLATAIQRREKAIETSARLLEIDEFGLEPESAGFHVLLPVEAFGRPIVRYTGIGQWDFAIVMAKYPDIPYNHPLASTGIGASASYERLFPNQVIGDVQATEVSGEGWKVTVYFNQRAIDLLAVLHGPLVASVDHTDWLGLRRNVGEASSEMRLVVSHSDHLYLPFSATALVQAGVPATVTVANSLTYEEASAIKKALEN